MRMTIDEIINNVGLVAQKYELVEDVDGSIRVKKPAGNKVGLITAIAHLKGVSAYDDIEAAGRMCIPHGVVNTIQKAADKAPGYNSAVRGRIRAFMTPQFDINELCNILAEV